MMSKVVLVTGATGFVGSHLVKALQQQPEGVRCRLLHRKTSDLSLLKGLDFESAVGDVTDPASLQQALQGVDTVFHLAALIAYSKAQRDLMQRVNVEGTRNVVQACVQVRVSKLVHMSSVAAIGASFNPHQVLDESSPYNLAHLKLGYHDTKRESEQIVLQAVREQNLPAVVVNPSVIYGAGDATKGSRQAQRRVAQGRLAIYPSGGANVVSVHEVVRATLAAARQGRVGERYILGGQNLTIQAMFCIIAQHAGVRSPRWAVPSWALHALGWLGDRVEARRWAAQQKSWVEFKKSDGAQQKSAKPQGEQMRAPKKHPKTFFMNSDRAWAATLFHYFSSRKAERELGLKIQPAQVPIVESLDWMKQQNIIKSEKKMKRKE